VAINPPSDIVLGSILAADPSKYRAAADRLGRAGWDAISVSASPVAARSGSASQPNGAASESTSTSAQAPPAAPARVAAAGRGGRSPDAFAQLEAFVLQSFIQTMLPKNSQSFFGKGTAGEVWRSMLAEKLGAQIASSGQVGLAKRLAAGRSDAQAIALPTAALGGPAPALASLTSILPYIQSAAPADVTPAGENASADERS
jgi:hypothetical protein